MDDNVTSGKGFGLAFTCKPPTSIIAGTFGRTPPSLK